MSNSYYLVTLILSGITVIVLLLTLKTYSKILKVSEDNLSFMKRQTTFNSYFDNYKLFTDLSKRKTDIIYHNDYIDKLYLPYFENLTFDTLYTNYKNILINYSSLSFSIDPRTVGIRNPAYVNYKKVFLRFNSKIQSFIDIIYIEILKIRDDDNLTDEQKGTFVELYSNFILFDYINLANELDDEIEKHKSEPILMSDLMQCNNHSEKEKSLEFDIEDFLFLYYELNKLDYPVL